MLCQRSSRSFAALFKPSRIQRLARETHQSPPTRTYNTLTSLRPTTFRSTLRSTNSTTASSIAATTAMLDLLPKVSTHPALSSMQVRYGPRNTFSPSHFVRKRRHGFLSRQKTRKGRAILKRRRLKRRSTLSH